MNHVILPSKEFSSLCTHPIRLPAYSDAGPGLGHCNILAHPRFTLTSRAQTGFSSPSSFFTLSSVRTFTHFSLALFPHFFLSRCDIRHFSTCGDRKNSSSQVPLSFATSTIQLLSPLFSMYLSRDMAGNRSLSSLYALFLSPSITYPFTVTHCAPLTEYVE